MWFRLLRVVVCAGVVVGLQLLSFAHAGLPVVQASNCGNATDPGVRLATGLLAALGAAVGWVLLAPVPIRLGEGIFYSAAILPFIAGAALLVGLFGVLDPDAMSETWAQCGRDSALVSLFTLSSLLPWFGLIGHAVITSTTKRVRRVVLGLAVAAASWAPAVLVVWVTFG